MDDVRQTVELAHKLLQENPHAGIWPPSIYTPYPGTPLFDESLDHGFSVPQELEDFDRLDWHKSNIPWLTPEMESMLKKISYIITGSGTDYPLISRWFRFRFCCSRLCHWFRFCRWLGCYLLHKLLRLSARST